MCMCMCMCIDVDVGTSKLYMNFDKWGPGGAGAGAYLGVQQEHRDVIAGTRHGADEGPAPHPNALQVEGSTHTRTPTQEVSPGRC